MRYLWICQNKLCNCIKIGCEKFPIIDYNGNRIYWLFQKVRFYWTSFRVFCCGAIELIQQVKMNWAQMGNIFNRITKVNYLKITRWLGTWKVSVYLLGKSFWTHVWKSSKYNPWKGNFLPTRKCVTFRCNHGEHHNKTDQENGKPHLEPNRLHNEKVSYLIVKKLSLYPTKWATFLTSRFCQCYTLRVISIEALSTLSPTHLHLFYCSSGLLSCAT